jgi:hypothetical protein
MVTQLTQVLRKIDDSQVLHLVCVVYDQKQVFNTWYLSKSDLVILEEVCKHIGVGSPVGFYEVPTIVPQESEEDEDDESYFK